MHTFDTPSPTTLVVRSGAGHVMVKAEETARTTVELTALNGRAKLDVPVETLLRYDS